jgi:hypothetical protein
VGILPILSMWVLLFTEWIKKRELHLWLCCLLNSEFFSSFPHSSAMLGPHKWINIYRNMLRILPIEVFIALHWWGSNKNEGQQKQICIKVDPLSPCHPHPHWYKYCYHIQMFCGGLLERNWGHRETGKLPLLIKWGWNRSGERRDSSIGDWGKLQRWPVPTNVVTDSFSWHSQSQPQASTHKLVTVKNFCWNFHYIFFLPLPPFFSRVAGSELFIE